MLNLIKIPILSFLFISLLNPLAAQQFSFEFGKVMSTFNYTDSQGESLDNLEGSTNNHIGIGVKLPIQKSKIYAFSAINHNQYGAKGSDALVGNYYDWKVNYVGVDIGIGYEFFKVISNYYYPSTSKRTPFTIYTQIAISSEFLVQGIQTINNQTYNLIGVEQFDKPFIFGKAGLGLTYFASRYFSIYSQYTGGKSFSVFKSESDDQEILNYTTHMISLGVLVNLPHKKP